MFRASSTRQRNGNISYFFALERVFPNALSVSNSVKVCTRGTFTGTYRRISSCSDYWPLVCTVLAMCETQVWNSFGRAPNATKRAQSWCGVGFALPSVTKLTMVEAIRNQDVLYISLHFCSSCWGQIPLCACGGNDLCAR